jgi:sensor histidine kinase YesM
MYTGKRTASILIDINEEKWRNLYSAETDENYLFLMYGNDVHINFSGAGLELEIDNINEIIAASKQQAGFQVIDVDSTQYLMASEQTGYSDLISVTGAPRQYLMKSMNKNLRAFVMLYLVIIVVSFVLATILSYAVTNPIKKMISYVRAVSERHAEPDLLDTQYHPARPEGMFVEFDEFASAFDEMLKHLEKYYADIHHQQLLLKNAEIKALHAQMAPHFLFNVLNTIAWKAEMNGNTDIYKMTISLSELLRANILSNDKDFVSFKEELSYVKFYVQLQQYRFEDKFTVEIHCDETWYEFLVPRFSIQSLVENAICHGLEPLRRDGLLTVTVLPYQENSIYVEVADNGAGFPDDFDINAVPAANDQLKEVRHTRVGLKNLNQRLKLLGSDDGLSIKRELKGECRTVVSFRIPTMRGKS